MKVRGGVKVVTLLADNSAGIWYGTGQPQSSLWERGIPSLLQEPWLQGAERILILGSRNNADLICSLYEHKLKVGAPYNLLVASPFIRQPSDAGGTFRAMLGVPENPAAGGWHTVSAADYRTYAFLKAFASSGGRLTDHVKLAYLAHPARAALSFVPDLDLLPAAKLLTEIIDPRFVNAIGTRPFNVKLKRFLGIERGRAGYQRVINYLEGNPPSDSHQHSRRADLVFQSWAVRFREKRSHLNPGPRDFLYRRVADQCTSDQALFYGSRYFVEFLQAVWLDGLTPSRKYEVDAAGIPRLQPSQEYSPTLFVPEYFFRDSREVEAWKYHLAKLPAV